MSGVGCVVALGNCFMPVRIERLAKALLGLDAVLVKQKEQLSKGHLHTLMKLWGAPSCTRGQSTFEVINCRQQFVDERFFLRGRTGVAFLAVAPFEILKIGSHAQVQVFLFGELLTNATRLIGCSLTRR